MSATKNGEKKFSFENGWSKKKRLQKSSIRAGAYPCEKQLKCSNDTHGIHFPFGLAGDENEANEKPHTSAQNPKTQHANIRRWMQRMGCKKMMKNVKWMRKYREDDRQRTSHF